MRHLLCSCGGRAGLSIALLLSATSSFAQQPSTEVKSNPLGRQEELPEELEGVGITEKLGARIPRDLIFTDSTGEQVRLGELLDGRKPLLLTMNYSDCPMLCNLQLNALVEGLSDMQWTLGDEYRVVTVSLDPKEAVERAAATKERYLNQYGEHAKKDGWKFSGWKRREHSHPRGHRGVRLPLQS